MTKEAVVTEVIELLDSYGDRLLWIHIPDSRGMDGHPGFPDFLIAGRRGILFGECKPVHGRLRPAQWSWRCILLESGQRAVTWEPYDLVSGAVRAALEAIA
jgi:hypothetical protein